MFKYKVQDSRFCAQHCWAVGGYDDFNRAGVDEFRGCGGRQSAVCLAGGVNIGGCWARVFFGCRDRGYEKPTVSSVLSLVCGGSRGI